MVKMAAKRKFTSSKVVDAVLEYDKEDLDIDIQPYMDDFETEIDEESEVIVDHLDVQHVPMYQY